MSLQVLIVDDSPIIRSVIEKHITLAGVGEAQCHHAEHGRAALDVMAERWIDIAFVDINMPVMNGQELIERMKADQLLATIPVIVASTEGSATRIDALEHLGIAGYLRKPFTPEQFKDLIHHVMERRDAA